MYQDHEFGWDDVIQQDSTEPIVLEPGDYIFTVDKFERARYTPGPSSKLPACNMAKITLKITTDKGEATVVNNLYLHSSTEGLLSAFFSAIGQKRKGEPLKMNWNNVVGARGAVKIKNRTYKDNLYNEVDKFYPSDSSYYADKETPTIVQQLGQPVAQPNYQHTVPQQPTYPQQPMPSQPQTGFNQAPQQPGNYTPGAF